MRNIKFRAWLKDENKMAKVHSIHLNKKRIMVTYRTAYGASGNCAVDDGDYVLQQYTGLKDNNGVEIYEGDIVKWSDGFYEERHQAEVKYGIGEFDGGVYKYAGFYLEGDGRILEPYEITNMIKHKEYYSYEVVGNIFEGVDK